MPAPTYNGAMSPSRLCLFALFLWCGLSSAMAAPGKSCEWRQPGHDPYMGDLPGAVDHYLDIPVATRERLKERMRRLDYDDLVTVRAHAIDGRLGYEPAIRQMHFGEGRVCAEVTRESWPADHAERGLAYCEDGFCLLVPFVCRNLSRIRQRPQAASPQAPGAPAGRPGTVAAAGPVVAPGASGLSAGPDPGAPGPGMRSAAALLPGLRTDGPYRTDFPGQPTLPVYPGNVQSPSPPSLVPVPVAPVLQQPPVGPRTPLSPVPEPGTGLMLVSGLVVLLPRALRAARR